MHLKPGKFAEDTFFPFLIWIATLPSALKPFGQLASQKDPSLAPFVCFAMAPTVSQLLVKLTGFLKAFLTFLELEQYLCIMLFDATLYAVTPYSPKEKQFLVADLILVT